MWAEQIFFSIETHWESWLFDKVLSVESGREKGYFQVEDLEWNNTNQEAKPNFVILNLFSQRNCVGEMYWAAGGK